MAARKDSKKARVLPFPKKGIAISGGRVSNVDINASPAERPAALGEDELRAQVQRIVCYGTVRESWHSRNDRSYRNVSLDDIQHLLRSEWKLSGKPQWKPEHGNWAYKVVGQDLDEDELTLIIAVNADRVDILVITKF